MIFLGNRLHEVQLSDQPDVIRWRWTADGQYTAKSAYRVQFAGSYCTFDSTSIWKAKVEGKHRFFAWLLVQRKVLTADKLLLGREKKIKLRIASLLIYTAWNIWRERNRRIFEGKSALPRVVALIKEEVHLRNQACGGEELILVS
ncbi:hypothetical protein HU200_001103 [Digitaria exilis]|uniref:Reverse transcriptase zinc-binding domain-containing protein n=1 Tax=Digitaria exilis TaxID=1010633 RepID=A0A835G0Z9_9POAL|nr:hypothetical protein HU200_001103 [Digitaria exilis]